MDSDADPRVLLLGHPNYRMPTVIDVHEALRDPDRPDACLLSADRGGHPTETVIIRLTSPDRRTESLLTASVTVAQRRCLYRVHVLYGASEIVHGIGYSPNHHA
ncbi:MULTISPECIES: hypothetical protein [unclassified Modestobacter]